ncbi:MAG: 5'-nucleotidase C-terminal domain-containing protein [Bacteroidia bacterium]
MCRNNIEINKVHISSYLLWPVYCVFIILGSLSSCTQSANQKSVNPIKAQPLDSAIVASADIKRAIAPYKKELEAKMNTVIGFAANEFNNNCGESRESTLGNFVADLLLVQTKKVFDNSLDLAVINHHGGLRTPIRKGNITVQNIYELMPFDNEMWVLEIEGNLVQQLFDNAAQRKSNCIAGATYTIASNKKATDIIINNKPFDENKTYRVSISDYLAGGGGGHSFFKNISPVYDTDYKCRDMIIDYIKANSADKKDTLVPKIDGRVKMSL